MPLKKGCRLWWLVLPGVLLDRITKQAATTILAPHSVKPAISGVLSWAYTRNHGAAFSILTGKSILLVLLTIALIAALLIYLLRHTEIPNLERAGIWCIIAGGLGNLWDRIAYGSVIDFIRLDFVNFPIFNVADIFVCCGAAAVVLAVMLSEGRKKHV